MGFSKGAVSTESVAFKKYIGVASVSVLAVNPNKEELEKLYGRTFDKAPEYVGEVEVNGEKVPQVRIDFIVKADPTKYKNLDKSPVDFITKISFFVAKKYKVGSTSGKYQILDLYGRSAWATKEDIENKRIPQYSNGPANIDAKYRPAYIGEEELINFIKAYLNIPNVEKWENGHIVGLIDNPSEAEALLDHVDDYFKGDFTELKAIIKYQPENKVKALFGIKTNDDKVYQTVFTRKFLKNNVSDYSRLDKEVKSVQDNGALSTSVFECVELHEYDVESTDLSTAPTTTESPFEATPDAATPW